MDEVTMARRHVKERVDRSRAVFPDRVAAGRRLAEYMNPDPEPEAVVLGVPRGGVPVGKALAHTLRCPLHAVLTRNRKHFERVEGLSVETY